jgi:hypothetical protein
VADPAKALGGRSEHLVVALTGVVPPLPLRAQGHILLRAALLLTVQGVVAPAEVSVRAGHLGDDGVDQERRQQNQQREQEIVVAAAEDPAPLRQQECPESGGPQLLFVCGWSSVLPRRRFLTAGLQPMRWLSSASDVSALGGLGLLDAFGRVEAEVRGPAHTGQEQAAELSVALLM